MSDISNWFDEQIGQSESPSLTFNPAAFESGMLSLDIQEAISPQQDQKKLQGSKETAAVMDGIGFCLKSSSPTSSYYDLQTGSGSMFERAMNIREIAKQYLRLKGKSLRKVVSETAQQDDLAGSLIDFMADVSCIGMAFSSRENDGQVYTVNDTPEFNDGNVTALDKDVIDSVNERNKADENIQKISSKFDLKGVAASLAEDWWTHDSMILCWLIDKESIMNKQAGDALGMESVGPPNEIDGILSGGIVDVFSIDPSTCDWVNSMGRDSLIVEIPEDIISTIQRIKTLRQADEAVIAECKMLGIPESYTKAVLKGDRTVVLLNSDGYYWEVRTRARKFNGLAKPSMSRVLLSIHIRRMFTEADLAGAVYFKHFIQHVKLGESVTQGPMAGQRNNWAKEADIDSMNRVMNDAGKAGRLTTNHTVEVSWIHPPTEMFSGARYEEHTKRIFGWIGVSEIMHSGSGGKYASGFISIKRTISKIIRCRETIADIFSAFFKHPSIQSLMLNADSYGAVTAGFDENVLKEPRQILDELKFLFEKGMGDPEVSIRELGRDPKRIRRSKIASKVDDNKTGVWRPIFATSVSGRVSTVNDVPGRPPLETTTLSEASRTRSPSPAVGSRSQ